ncbi:hypothetical protein M8C21_023829 [Ambrosia artemisiifolia]|uniref:Trichome birefringence-like N-terminal domain-containing protein n=1 Tax=Ambrosia artemisiifolia TaxID=4212 RepID=A0AAD5BST6_AMBAR|nr:hypothetical protein M8C21_023829 [Ambrosia artemisiifolia]
MDQSFVVLPKQQQQQQQQQRSGAPPPRPHSVKAGAMEDSFVVLPPPAASVYNSAADVAHLQPSPTRATTSGFHSTITILNRAFEIATAQTQVDHPLCLECMRVLSDKLDKELEDVNTDIKAYEACLHRFEGEPRNLLTEADFLREKLKIEEEERKLEAAIQETEKQCTQVTAELKELELKSNRFKELEERYWHEFNNFQFQLISHQTDLDDTHLSSDVKNGSFEECDIFNGRWVRDDTKPLYRVGSCPYIDRDFDCHLNKRPDDEYVKWKWQPFGCEIPSLNATDFLERLRGKKLVFVGDSLNRNMWESLDYNCTIDFVSSPFLVRESSITGKNGSVETLRLDLMDKTTSMYHDADVLVFNTGHWWTHEKTSRGEDYYQEGDHVYPRLKVLDAYIRALSTWARWVDENIDINKTQVIFRGYSVTHFKGGQWNSGGKCHKETEPIFNSSHLTKYPTKMRAFDNVLREMKNPVIYLNISRLTDYRKDGHPSIYRMEYKSVEEQIAAVRSQDCSHWCLPGVPDTWNELLYASLLKVGRGSWKI